VSHPDPKHDPENVLEDDKRLRDEVAYKEYEEYMEWCKQQEQVNDEERV
jgi:3-hydroxy-3-methylglutaryl CoA synthase